MKLRSLTSAVGLTLLAGVVAGPACLAARDTEEELLARLQKEHNPVRRAKYDIRLGRIKLEQAIAAYDQGNLDVGVQRLDVYLQRIKDAWQALHDSGRNAARQPQGFKELDIALREDIRLLEDLRHRLSYYDREPVRKVLNDIEIIRSEVLHELFPAERSPSTGDQPVHPEGPPRREMFRRSLSTLRLAGPPESLPVQGQEILSDEEDTKVRQAQDPSDRIQVYLEISQVRLDRVDEYRQKPEDPQRDVGAYLGTMMSQYITLTDEMKSWIQDQYDRQGDMRRGLRKLLETGPHQLEELRRIQESPGPYSTHYRKAVADAIDDLSDALDGATQALEKQEKTFGELKKQEKADARAAKVREKDDKKRAKEEKKLRKRERKRRAPTDEDED